MKTIFLLLFAMTVNSALAQETDSISKVIIGIEKTAMEKWNKGDPSGFLKISAKDVVYFDPYTEQRLDGLDKLTKLYNSLRGQIKVDKYEMINPNVQAVKNMAVLTYNLVSVSGDSIHKWNCTEVYRIDHKKWKIIQTHWSLTKPDIKK
jgi:hypothetical protein